MLERKHFQIDDALYLRDISFRDLEKALSYPNLVETVILDG